VLAPFGCALFLLLTAAGAPQTPQAVSAAPAAPATPTPQSQAPAIRTSTQLVVLDVVVEDSNGHPVHNLPRDAFHVTEKGAPQTIDAFEEHSTAHPPKPRPEMPALPPGTFTNYTPVAPGGALNVLLVDSLNTPLESQAYLHEQLRQYVNKAQPGMQVAIFGLNSRLYLLQGFTSNPETLKNAVNHKLIPRGSRLLEDPGDNSTNALLTDQADFLEDMGQKDTADRLRQFDAQTQSNETQLRLQYTLDAFEAIARYLSSFPGRKNLLWFSGAFPINILPDATLNRPFDVVQENSEEFREITGLLSRSQVAVYPIDARGLVTQSLLDASNSGSQYARRPGRLNDDFNKFFQSQAEEHSTMDQMASDTGGRAYYNTNGLADAVASALETGSNYYTLAYRPTDRNPHGEYRSLHVELTGPAAAGLHLSYRHGYYAEDPAHTPQPAVAEKPAKTASGTHALPVPSDPAAVYGRAAMLHGAPLPEDILFKVRILPTSATTDTTLSPHNMPNPAIPFKGPYRQYAVDIALKGSNFRLTRTADGNYTGKAEFKTFVYDSDGKLLNLVAQAVQFNLPLDNARKMLQSALNMHLEVSAPAKSDSYLRVGVRDVTTNQYGVVEIPTAVVSRLPPLPPGQEAAPASTPAAGPGVPPAATQPQGRSSVPR
jgi:VWFA-related protein